MRFADRPDAGRRLADRLKEFRDADVVVLALPRGGVPVAAEVARALDAPLDVIVVRKLGVPFQPELAMGAVGEGGVRVVDAETMRLCQVTSAELHDIETTARAEVERRARRFRGDRPRISLQGRVALIIDDGVATGSTARAACQVARAHGAKQVAMAVPVGSPDAVAALRDEADTVVCLEQPPWFRAVGQWYDDFRQTTDEQVVGLLRQLPVREPTTTPEDPTALDDDVEVFSGMTPLAGHLTIPDPLRGLVVFAHGSGSTRHSPRNRHAARVLGEAGLGTLLVDLLTHREEVDRRLVFDIGLLAERLAGATAWVREQPRCQHVPIGYFGAGTGAAAALWIAADPGSTVSAIVSCGGRPDLAEGRLHEVRAPTLLIVGGQDHVVLDLNRQAHAKLQCERELTLVPGATHLFEEPGALGRVAELARDWFLAHLAAVQDNGPGAGRQRQAG